MKHINEYINEAATAEDWCYYNGFEGTFVHSDKATMDAYMKKAKEYTEQHMGTCSKKADPKSLLDGVESIWGSERTNNEIYVVFDKTHESAKCGLTLASVIWTGEVSDDADKKTFDDYYKSRFGANHYCISGCVREIKGKKVFDMYLS